MRMINSRSPLNQGGNQLPPLPSSTYREAPASVAFTLDTDTDALPDLQETAAPLIADLVPRRRMFVVGVQTACLPRASRLRFGLKRELRGKDSNLDYLIQSQASYH